MINLVGTINGINIYSDEYQEINKILKGRKQGYFGTTFMIAHPITANKLIMIHRIEKIKKIKDRICLKLVKK